MSILGEEVGEAEKLVVDYRCENPVSVQEDCVFELDFEAIQRDRLTKLRAELVQATAVLFQVIAAVDQETEQRNNWEGFEEEGIHKGGLIGEGANVVVDRGEAVMPKSMDNEVREMVDACDIVIGVIDANGDIVSNDDKLNGRSVWVDIKRATNWVNEQFDGDEELANWMNVDRGEFPVEGDCIMIRRGGDELEGSYIGTANDEEVYGVMRDENGEEVMFKIWKFDIDQEGKGDDGVYMGEHNQLVNAGWSDDWANGNLIEEGEIMWIRESKLKCIDGPGLVFQYWGSEGEYVLNTEPGIYIRKVMGEWHVKDIRKGTRSELLTRIKK